MKKYLIILAMSCLAAASLRADLIWYEGFNYADGPTTNVSSGVWLIHSTSLTLNGTNAPGTPPGNDSYIKNHRLEISGNSSTNAARQSDVHRDFCTSACTYTNGAQIVYASFTVNCTNLPTTVNNYFAHFQSSSGSQQCRIFSALGTTPGTWRVGIAGAAANASKIFSADLAPNVDYQVVVKWNPTSDTTADSFAGTLWINPISAADPNVISGDIVTAPPAAAAFSFRQASGATSFFVDVTNLAVATTFDEVATNVWTTNAVTPIVATQPKGGTNFVGDTINLFAVVAGQGQANITYQWQKDGLNVSNPNLNSNVFTIFGAAASDSGDYALIATTPYGLSVTTAVATLWVTNPPVPPSITQQPGNTNVFAHQNVSLKVVATGPPPLSYAWFLNNDPVVDGPNFLGANSDTLVVSDITAGNGTTGTYRVDVTNPFGTTSSTNFVLAVTNPPSVSIAFLRTLVDTNFTATNTTQLWQVTGTVTTFANLTTGNTASYYLQDGTGGINIFETFGQTFRPQQGDVVTFVGSLSTFRGTLELLADPQGNPASGPIVLSNNVAALPAPKTIPYFASTNGNPIAEPLEGTIVMLTNVYLGTNAGTTINTNVNNNATSVVVTNANGDTFWLGFAAVDTDPAGKVLPDFAYSIVGPLTQDTTTHAGYQIAVTRFSDIVTDAPPAVTVTATHTNNLTTLSWQDVAHDPLNFSYGSNYSYTVLASPHVTGPYLPVGGYQAHMLGANENPSNPSTGRGFGTVELSPDESTITVNMTFSGLTSAATQAHIHGPAGAGTNASVLFPFSGVPAATSGSIPQQTFAINATQVGYLKTGLLYMNVHTGPFPGGELRAQLLPVPSTGLTFTNGVASYTDRNATNSATFYRVVSP